MLVAGANPAYSAGLAGRLGIGRALAAGPVAAALASSRRPAPGGATPAAAGNRWLDAGAAGQAALLPGHRDDCPPVLARRRPLLGTIRPGWACSTAVSAGDSSINGAFARKRAKWTGWIQGNLRAPGAHGNPEPSRRYTGGRCRDYLGAAVPLMTGMSIPHPHALQACVARAVARVKR